jgi:putative serine/threonine protein kinase|tara:strand:- start:433 stop:1194 length:762 start_codon:yes stop_codon:yes gene_type:complete
MSSVSVKVNLLSFEPYVDILCYPSSDGKVAKRRVEELLQLGVSEVVFEGKTKIGGLGLLGKGCVSLVIKAKMDNGIYALKIRRTDANRPSMYREAELHRFANQVNVGPTLHNVSDNFILLDLVDDEGIVDWIRNLKGLGSTARLRNVVQEVLKQAYKLDQAGLDHGELSNLKKHVFAGEKVTIIDFETASKNRRVSNVTSAVQNIFIGGPQARKVRRLLRLNEIQPIIDSVRKYKAERNMKLFEVLLKDLKLV